MIALSGGTLVELRPPRVRRATLLVEGSRIAAICDGAIPPELEAQITEVIDCQGCLVLPGLVCAHTHLYSALACGMPPPAVAPETFPEILERVWWRLDRALDADGIETSALVGAATALRAGVTTVVDHHASPALVDGSLDLVGGALERAGLRGVLCYEVTDRNGEHEARAGVRENDRFLSSLRNRERPLLRGMVGAHAGFTLGHPTTVALADVAVRHQAGVHIHVAEDACDASHVVPVRDVSIVEWLAEYRLLDARALLAHCVHVSDEDAARIVASSGHVAHNPRSNMNNRVGYSRPARFADRLLLGTDGIGADVLTEAHAAFLAARDHRHDFDPLAALARNHSFAAAQFDAGLGRLEPGCPADLAVFAYDPPTPLDETNLFGHLLFGLPGRGARDVVVDGRVALRDGKLTLLDERALAETAREAAARLWKRMAEL